MIEFLPVWSAGFGVGVGAALLIFKISYPFQLVKTALADIG